MSENADIERAGGQLTGRKTIWGLADQIVLSILGFAVMLILARAGDRDQLGFYAIANSIIVLLLSAQDSLVTRPYAIQIFKPVGSPQAQAFSSMVFSLAISLIGFLGAMAVAAYLQAYSSGYVPLAIAIAVVAPLILMREFARRFSLSNMRMMSAFGVDASAALVAVIILILLHYTGALTAVTALLALGAGAAVASMKWYTGNKSSFQAAEGHLQQSLRQSWSLGKWLFVGQSAMQMQGYAVHWICLALISASATGAYAAVLSIVAIANPILYGFFNLIMVSTVRTLKSHSTRGLRRQVMRDSAVLAALMALFTIAIVVSGGTLLALLYPAVDLHQEGPVISVLILASIAAAAGAIGGPAAIALQGMEKAKELAIVSVAVFVLGAVLTWFLIGRYGLLGTGLALLATEVLGFIVRWCLFWVMARK